MGCFDTCTEKIYELTDFFIEHYPLSESIDLLAFYEAYHREKKDKNNKKKHTPSLEAIKKRNAIYLHSFIDLVKERLSASDVINLTQKDVLHIPQSTTASSFSAFFHIISAGENEEKIVINSTAPGFGKMYSRFLTLFPSDLTNELRNWNKKSKEDALLTEPTDATAFNANLHPSLMPFEITAPDSYTTLPKKQQIPITDIEIVYKKSDNRIHFIYKKSKKEIFAFDLGFQGSKGRSELYSFLSFFTLGAHHHINQLNDQINKKIRRHYKKKQVIILPRIVYENRIVLQRKTWEVSRVVLPTRNPQESNWEYFKKINRWRNGLSLPDEIFIKKNNNKPQYINFTNPFLISLFEKVIGEMKEKDVLKIEEMLPASKNIANLGKDKSVTEFLSQWNY